MSSEVWTSIFAFVALAAVGIALAFGVRSRQHRALLAAQLQARIDASKVELEVLKDRLAANDIDSQTYDEQSQVLASNLLSTSAGAPYADATGRRRRIRPVILMSCLLMAGLVAAAVYLLEDRISGAPRPAPVGDRSASSAQAPSRDADRSVRALSDEQLQRMVDQATAQVKSRPKDAAAWAMLAHSYDMLGKFAESTKAYAQLVRLLPNDAQVLADYADALAVANGRTLKGEPTALVNKALAIDAKNLKALALAGTAAYELKDYAQAVSRWELALTVATDPAIKRQIEDSVASAKAVASGETLGATSALASARTAGGSSAASGALVSGRVILADDLIARAAPDATVFIFARPVNGSRMPVALLRRKVRDLPVDFVLDDSTAMVRDVKLSQVPMVVIGARISARGDVMPQPGDMQGWSAPVSIGTRGVKLEISEVLK